MENVNDLACCLSLVCSLRRWRHAGCRVVDRVDDNVNTLKYFDRTLTTQQHDSVASCSLNMLSDGQVLLAGRFKMITVYQYEVGYCMLIDYGRARALLC